MNIVELILLIVGICMFPYGIYEVWKGNGDKDIKLVIIGISLALFIVETVLVFITK
ncbi:hypothetical protein SUSAZ_02255 [Sulfolobus acidocaldarius SUSAZ]|nr:hypothetical protein SUSAZ_02255 [Sulfolobus acidocaldarius SUSAZ]